MGRFLKAIDFAVAFLYCSALIAGSFFLQEPFVMSGSAATAILLTGFLFGLSYIFLYAGRPRASPLPVASSRPSGGQRAMP
jgi:hypothetical protein